MTLQQFTGSFKLSWKQIVVAALVIVYVVINIFKIGGNTFVINLNNNIVNPLAMVVTLLALMLWRQIAAGGRNRLLWSGLTIGWALWTVAEFWWGIAAIIGKEVPYPSWADFFWLTGYIPMSIALWERIRSLPRNIKPLQRMGIWFFVLLSMGWTILFVLIPIIQNNDPTAIVESALNILYPMADLVLLILVLRILFVYQRGMYGGAWGWLLAGFVVHSLSNLIFSYASTANLYYPNGQIDLLSALGIDVPYNLSYLLWLIGLFILQTRQSNGQALAGTSTATLPLVPNTHLLVFTKGDDTVIDVSHNYSRVFYPEAVEGQTISKVLGLPPRNTDSLLRSIKLSRILKEQAILVNTGFGQQQAWVSGISVADPQGKYSGVTLLLRIFTKDHSLDKLLADEEKGVVDLLLNRTGTKEKEEEEIKRLLSNYYLAYLQAFYDHVFAEGGEIMADAFFIELQSVAREHDWRINARPDVVVDASALSPSKTREALPILFETARRFVAKIADESTANTIINNVRSRFDDTALMNVALFEKI